MLCITKNTKSIIFYTLLKDQTFLFQTIQVSISHWFALSLTVKLFSLTHRQDSLRCYHFRPELVKFLCHSRLAFSLYVLSASMWCIRIVVVTQRQPGKNHHHHRVVPLARISLTLSRHFSLSFIAFGRSSGLHPVSSHSCCMYVRAVRPAFAWP